MDRGVFFLATTVVFAGIGYFAGRALDDGQPKKIFGIVNTRIGAGAGTLAGALIGAGIAATYLYLELLSRIVVLAGATCANHPFKVLAVAALFILMLAAASRKRDNDNRTDTQTKSLGYF